MRILALTAEGGEVCVHMERCDEIDRSSDKKPPISLWKPAIRVRMRT